MKKLGLLVVLCMALAVTGTAQAGKTTVLGNSGWTMFVSNGMQPVDVPLIYSLDGSVIDLDKTFTRPKDELGFFTPIIVEFVKTSSTASSQITINNEYINNLTGVEWDGFQMQLMVNTLNPQAGFNPVAIDGDQLEGVSYSNNVGLGGLPILLSFANTQGDGVLSGIFADAFKPGFVVGSVQININPNAPIGTRIGLKEIPIAMPEPATVMMLGLGALAIMKKRKQNLC